MTILWVGFVQGALAQDVTGATALSLSETLSSPAGAMPQTSFGISVAPAAYGHLELSSAVAALQLRSVPLTIAVAGTGGGAWRDLQATVSAPWQITSMFLVGTSVTGSWSGATGFPSDVGLSANVHTCILLDPTWSVACGVDQLLQVHTRYEPLSPALRLGASWKGAVTVSGGFMISPTERSSLRMAAVHHISEMVALRASLESSPLTIGASVRLSAGSLPPTLIAVRWTDDLGLRTRLNIDIP